MVVGIIHLIIIKVLLLWINQTRVRHAKRDITRKNKIIWI